MQRWLPLILIALSAYQSVIVLAAPESVPDGSDTAQPNILLIVLDDFGYNDLGANGNPATPTPNLDAFAAQGARYTRHYADATCSVARAALLTSTLPARQGLRPDHLGLSPDTPTIASALGKVGYTTRHIGKWHVANPTLAQSPSELGFDSWFGFLFQNELGGPSSDGIHYKLPTYTDPWLRENQSVPQQYPGHLTDILTERALTFIDQQKGQPRPWFLNLWYYAPHHPIEPSDTFRQEHPATPEGSYHALIDQVDTRIGEILQRLEHTRVADNTLVVILSDNGGTNRETDNNAPFHGKKSQFFEGGVRTPLMIRWPGRTAPGSVSDELVSIVDIFPTLARASGASIPSEAIGRNLLAQDALQPLPLYWEYSNSKTFMYSILSANGRWRLTSGSYLGAVLNDLEADPSGKVNVVEQHPEVGSKLRQDFKTWRRQARVVDYTYQQLSDKGTAILSGRDLLRSPGRAGFSFALAVTPADAADRGQQVIAEQTGRWRIETNESGALQVDVLDHSLTSPPLPAGECSHLVISAHFKFSPRKPQLNWASVELYLNGKEVDRSLIKNPQPHNWGYANPTYLGSDTLGKKRFQGTLGRPLILNEGVINDKNANALGNGISGVPDTCKP